MQIRFDPHQNNVSNVWLTLPLQNVTSVHKSCMITSSRRLFIQPLSWTWMPRTQSKQLSLPTKSLPAVQHRYLIPHIRNGPSPESGTSAADPHSLLPKEPSCRYLPTAFSAVCMTSHVPPPSPFPSPVVIIVLPQPLLTSWISLLQTS